MQITSTTQQLMLKKCLPLIVFLIGLFAGYSVNAQNAPCVACKLNYPDNSNLPRSAQVFNESDCLIAMDPGASICGVAPAYIKVWYTDEHALTLGVRRVIVKTAAGTTTTDYPITPTPASPTCVDNPLIGTTIQTGDQSGNDLAVDGGRPLWPAVFITDLTVNGANSRKGDWQWGGTAIPPSRVCGTWKAAVRTVDKTTNPVVVTVTPDADPTANGSNYGGGDAPPAGLTLDKYNAEVAWKLSDLKLIPGHSYRLQFMVHDGDQNKTGGDVGDTCTTLTVAIPPSSIGDFVWNDNGGPGNNPALNQNGIQDAGEPGVPNITVTLYDAAGNVKGTTFTDATGHYIFNNVDVSGGCTQYRVGFSPLPSKYNWTKKHAGTDTTLDSNAPNLSQTSGLTDLFTVCPGQSRMDIDAGMFNPGGVQAVTMSSFQGKYENGTSLLSWFMASQDNIASYDVQRSIDGANFSTIGNVKSGGSSYTFTDKFPVAGTNYYRLKMNETTGYFTFSNIISISAGIKGVNVRNVFPNPFVNRVGIDIITESDQTVEVRITDLSGRIIRKEIMMAQKGSNTLYVDNLKSLQSGLYLVEVHAGPSTIIKKLYKNDDK